MFKSVFAKYVTKDTATATAVIEKFGVTLSVSSLSDADKAKYGVTVTDNSTPNLKNAGVYSITVSGLKMGPGDTINDLISFTIGGKANVNCRLKIDPIVTFETDNIVDDNPNDNIKPNTFFIPNGVGVVNKSGAEGQARFPIQVLCNGTINCYSPWKNEPTSDELDSEGNLVPGNVSYTIARILAQQFDVKCDNVQSEKDNSPKGNTDYVYKDFAAGTEPITFYKRNPVDGKANYNGEVSSTAVNKLSFGLKYPITYGTTNGDNPTESKYDEMATYLQEARDATFSITFVFTIEQTS